MKTVSFSSLSGLKKHEGGLTPTEVSTQLSQYGNNDIVEVAGNPWFEIFIETIKDPMLWFLVGIGTLFIFVGEIADGITLFVAVLPLLLMDAFLHWRTQASTAALKGQLEVRTKVIRDSKEVIIDSRELVPGDLVSVQPGSMLPADGIFELAKEIQVDESVLTGESFPVAKSSTRRDPFELSKEPEVLIAAENLGYAGTRILTGTGHLRILLTGARTSYGEIVQSVARMPHERTPLQKSITSLVQNLIYISVGFCLILAAVRVFQGHGWLDAFLSAATLAVAAIPEEFPVVFTFFLGVGVYRLAKNGALVRRAVSVENIGRVTQICTDKTGTITVGKLTLTHLEPGDGTDSDALLEMAAAASNSNEDPLDLAVQEAAQNRGLKPQVKHQIFPFTEDTKRETALIAKTTGGFLACTKGAPESLLLASTLSVAQKDVWRERISAWAKSGHKVIGVATKNIPQDAPAKDPQSEMNFLGILAFEDPPRPEVASAMAYCRANELRVLMITGDHPDTAAAIAIDSGLVNQKPVVVCAEDEPVKFREEWLTENADYIKNVDVVARCTPLQKLAIVMALKKSGEIVAVTGDGVNDVPALKAADIAIAMGERGSRSAKEVSSIILSDDNFSTIVNAIREGRQLFLNLKKSFEYLLLIHVPLVSTAALVPLFGYPLVYLPVHVVWLELVIHPTALLAFQAGTKSNRKEFARQNSFFTWQDIVVISLAGLLVAIALGYTFLSGLAEPAGVDHARAKAIALLSIWSGGTAIYLTGFRSRAAHVLALLTTIGAVLSIQASGRLRFLHLAPLHWGDWLELSLFVVFVLLAVAILRRFLRAIQH